MPEGTPSCNASRVNLDVARQELLKEFHEGAKTLRRTIGYNPTGFNQLVGELGPVEAARRLINGSRPAEGFTTLWEHEKLDMSVEFIALLPWYTELFDNQDRSNARSRLESYEFDVDGHLERRSTRPPTWWTP